MKRLITILIVFVIMFASLSPKIVFAVSTTNTCDTCVCSNGAGQGAMATEDACSKLCIKNGFTFQSCNATAQTQGTANNTPSSSSSCPSVPSSGSAPAVTSATPCTCFCSTPQGASPQSGVMPVAQCRTQCQKLGDKKMVTCSYNGEDTPDHNQFCFTEAQCGALMGFDAKGNTISQPGRFQTGTSQAHDCPAPLSYCYANKGTPYKLAFPFDPKNTFVIDIGDYINKAYSWMIGAGMTIAIIMVMIGGLQYVLAAGSGSVEKGKKRIRNGIIGFILLLCVNLILKTVNPNLTILEVPAIPLVKQIGMTTVSCEQAAIAKGGNGKSLYTMCPPAKGSAKDGVYSGPEHCGTDDSRLSAGMGQTGVAAGSSCAWTSCSTFGQYCLNKKCVSCESANESNSPVKPSPSICGQLSPPAPKTAGSDTFVCEWKKEVTATTAVLSTLSPTLGAISNSANTNGKCILKNVTKEARDAEQLKNVDFTNFGNGVL